MKDQEKHCNTCASSYYQEEKNVNGGKDMVRMQHCSDPRYNSPVYTNQMLLEDWGNGCCRFWTPIPEKGNDYEKQITPLLSAMPSWKTIFGASTASFRKTAL